MLLLIAAGGGIEGLDAEFVGNFLATVVGTLIFRYRGYCSSFSVFRLTYRTAYHFHLRPGTDAANHGLYDVLDATVWLINRFRYKIDTPFSQ